MNKAVNFMRWIGTNFFYIVFALFVLLYLGWLRLNPLSFDPGEQASDSLIFGLALLFLYILVIGMMKFSQKDSFVRALSYVLAALFLILNALFVFVYFPRLRASAHLRGSTYYVTSNFPFLECCGYHQFTEWHGIFRYESNFYRYTMPPVRFIYDEKTDEVSLVDTSGDFETLYETFGESHRSYENFAKLGNHLYYSSPMCTRLEKHTCEIWTYTFYQCGLDNKSCTVLPVVYETPFNGWGDLRVKEASREIDFYFDPGISSDEALIYTYGDSPHCFANGCTITQ